MGLFENWPSSNLHAINLDYYLKQVKRVSDDIAIINSWKDELTGRVEHVEEIVEDLNNNVQELNNLYNTFVDTVNARFDELSASVDKRISDLSIAIQQELDRKIKEIDDFRFENRYPSRSAATLELIRLGMKQIKKEQAEKKAKKNSHRED